MFETCQDDMGHTEAMSDWIPVRDATRRYGVSRATLYRLISEGRVKRGKRAGDVRAYVSSMDLRDATKIHLVSPKARSASAPKDRRRERP